MKKRILIVLLSLVSLVLLYFVLRVIVPYNVKPLSSPTGFVLDGYTLLWETVNGAEGYEVEVEGEIRKTLSAKMDMRYNDNGKNVRVRALGDGLSATDSQFSESFAIIYSDSLLSRVNLVTYRLLEEGISRTEFNYKNALISIKAEDYTAYGYTFNGWYRIIDGSVIPITQGFFYDGNVTLYASVTPITYGLTLCVKNFPLPENAPTVFSMKTIDDVLALTSMKNGYKINGWYLDEACAFPATRENVPKADLTLYPRITLVNEGLSFEKSDGGCYVNGFAGLEKELHVPVEVNGECVLGLKDGAVIGHVADDQSSSEIAPNVERIVFHGDATVEGNAVGGCLYLNEVVFMGDANLSEGAFMFSTAHLASRVRFVFYGKPTLNVAFFAYYLGVSGNVSFEICVKTEYYNQTLAAFGSVATVTVIG